MEMVEKHWGERGKWAYAFGSLLDEGAVLAFGSDCPVEVFDPLIESFDSPERIMRLLRPKCFNPPSV
jgi:hypothetical protein